MNKILIVIAALTLSIFESAFCQVGILQLHNPGPRVGEEIELWISLQTKDLSYLNSKQKLTKEDYALISGNKVGTGELKITKIASDTGWISLGPLTFSFENTQYVTNEFKVKVYPALPPSIKDGLWIRVIEHNDKNFLIIEQRISSKWTRKSTSPNNFTLSHGESDVIYFELDEDKFEAMGIEIITSRSKSHSEVVDKSDALGDGTVDFKQAVYSFRKTTDFTKAFKVDEGLFKIYPEKGYTEVAWVK